MKKIIFTQRVEVIESYQERRDCADQRIADFINACGYLPIPVPNKSEIAADIVDAIQPVGIILTGGNSLVEYGGNAPERDAMDRTLIELSVQKSIPLYGFCRGMQSILVYFGNNLTQVSGHVAVRHVVKGSMGEIEVNSYHNQACTALANDALEILAQTDDGVIEAVRHKKSPIMGTMWHPERERIYQEKDMEMIKTLFH
jgi:putative glutamine amidotransferase